MQRGAGAAAWLIARGPMLENPGDERRLCDGGDDTADHDQPSPRALQVSLPHKSFLACCSNQPSQPNESRVNSFLHFARLLNGQVRAIAGASDITNS